MKEEPTAPGTFAEQVRKRPSAKEAVQPNARQAGIRL